MATFASDQEFALAFVGLGSGLLGMLLVCFLAAGLLRRSRALQRMVDEYDDGGPVLPAAFEVQEEEDETFQRTSRAESHPSQRRASRAESVRLEGGNGWRSDAELRASTRRVDFSDHGSGRRL
ncbi:hypothetical protein BASA81_002030 [Batrachochytrium salamandrivorans]|nr:hypothetical protein BASA81_002030 [Batrachochytrium salamandrivorans]